MEFTLGSIAGMIAALAFVALVGIIAVPMFKLGRVLEETRLAVRDIGNGTTPILSELQGTVRGVNAELDKVGVVTEDAARVTGHATVVSENAAQLATLFSATLGGPLVRTAAISYGVRQALKGGGGRRSGRAER